MSGFPTQELATKFNELSPTERARFIDSYKTNQGGWLKADLHRFGVAWPPPKGWRKRLLEEGMIIKEGPAADTTPN
jgi:hypothetical protein